MHDRSEWTRCPPGPKVIKDRTYTNLTEYSRACVTCKEPFSIFVTEKIAIGHADSNSFGLKNCPAHRRSAVRGDIVEVETLRMSCSVMKQELEGLYTRDKAQVAELQVLKARLASHGLDSEPTLTFPWQAG